MALGSTAELDMETCHSSYQSLATGIAPCHDREPEQQIKSDKVHQFDSLILCLHLEAGQLQILPSFMLRPGAEKVHQVSLGQEGFVN